MEKIKLALYNSNKPTKYCVTEQPHVIQLSRHRLWQKVEHMAG